MSVLRIKTSKALAPLLEPARYKGGHGGRGSGKSHFFAELAIEDALRWPGENGGEGLRMAGIREVQKTLKQSAKRLLEDKLVKFGLGEADGFRVFNEVIETPSDGVIIFQGMQDHNAESIKSLEGFKRAWIEEGQTLSAKSLQLLRPTIRDEGSEIWSSWNPRLKTDPIDVLLRQNPPTGAIVVQSNWSDNPWFPAVLEQERQDCQRDDPDQYDHIWEGGYVTVAKGSYFAAGLTKARQEGRICRVAADPLMTLRAYWDIGGTGAKADACSIWIAQFVGKEIRVLDHYTAQGQPLAAHVAWIRKHEYGDALMVLPHDGATNDKVYDVSYESALKDAGFDVKVVPNQGKGAAAARIEEVRRLMPRMWFDAEKTEAGRASLGWYHEKIDETRGVGLGPDHDWSSHDADAFGLMAVDYDEPTKPRKARARVYGAGGWMG